MQKIVIHRPGSYDRLKLEEHPAPTPGPREVLVGTRAIGVNYADVLIRMGLYESAKEYVGWPITPGFEFAGVVEAIGEEVEDLQVGAEVLGVTRFGAYASHVVVPRYQVFPVPQKLTLEQAGGVPTVFLTAYYGLSELAHPRPGQTILVHSAAGGVGGALLQLARIARCRPVGVVGASHKVEAARKAGAEGVIDKSREDLWARARQLAPEGYDVIFDANGASTLRDSYRHLAAPGKLVVYGFHSMMPKSGGKPNWLKLIRDYLRTPRFHPIRMTGENKSVLAFNLSYLFHCSDLLEESLEKILNGFETGELVAPQTTAFPLAQVAEAHRAIESGQTVGKLILVP